MIRLPDTRYQAFKIHLISSFVLFLILTAVLYFLWYPDYLFWTAGGLRGVFILMGVDLTIGPLLTLLVYKKGKPGMLFDMGAIVVLQLVCVIGGMATLGYSKPLAVVYSAGTYHSPAKTDFEFMEPDSLKSDKLSYWGAPKWYYINLTNEEAIGEAIQSAIFGSGPHLRTKEYEPYEEIGSGLDRFGKTINEAIDEEEIPTELAKGLDSKQYRVFSFTSAFNTGFLVIDITTGKVKAHHITPHD